MTSDHGFTANGSATVSFQTWPPSADIQIGADIRGKVEGVKGTCAQGHGVHGVSGIGDNGEEVDNWNAAVLRTQRSRFRDKG
jgi:hypothetical protein